MAHGWRRSLHPDSHNRTQDAVEDTKGNNGDSGRLQLTSLRVLWASQRAPRANISIGLNTIASFVLRPASSRLKGAQLQIQAPATAVMCICCRV